MRMSRAALVLALVFSCFAARAAENVKRYGHLGVALGGVPEALADQLGLEKGEGILVTHVAEGSPADTAGLKRSDVIVKIGDQIILSEEQIRKLIGYTPPGTKVGIELIRKSRRRTLIARLGGTDRAPVARGVWKTAPILGIPGVEARMLPRGMMIFRDALGGVGTIKMRGPDGKTVTLSFRGQKDLMEQLGRLEKNGVLDPRMAARMRRSMGLARIALGKGQKELEQKLKRPISFHFVQTPLTDVLGFMRGNCPVNQVVDPALAKTNPKITWRVTKISCRNAFEWLSRLAKTEFAVANETLCFGGADFVSKFKAITPLDSDNAAISAALKRRVSFDFVATPLKDTIAFLTNLLKVNVVVLGDGGRKETVSLRLSTAPAGLAFEYIGLLLGRDVAIEKEAIRFAEPAGAEPQGAPAP